MECSGGDDQGIEIAVSRIRMLEDENRVLSAKLRALETSRSWRLTAPLRRLTSMLREHHLLPRLASKFPGIYIEDFHWRSNHLSVNEIPVGVVVHIFYVDLAEEIADAVSMGGSFSSVVVTYTDPSSLSFLEDCFERHRVRNVSFILVENRGRDFFPFLTCITSGLLDDCEVVLKIHTKKSLHLDQSEGRRWRQSLLRGLLPGPEKVSHLVRELSTNNEVAWACPKEWIAGNESWGRNKKGVKELLSRVGLDRPRMLVFPAGSMFWMTRDLVKAFAELQLTDSDFHDDHLLDGGTGHALERFVGAWAVAKSRKIWSL